MSFPQARLANDDQRIVALPWRRGDDANRCHDGARRGALGEVRERVPRRRSGQWRARLAGVGDEHLRLRHAIGIMQRRVDQERWCDVAQFTLQSTQHVDVGLECCQRCGGVDRDLLRQQGVQPGRVKAFAAVAKCGFRDPLTPAIHLLRYRR